MKTQGLKLYIIEIISIIFILNSVVVAQNMPECNVVKVNSDGTYIVEIEGKRMLVITEEIEKKMLKMRRDLLDAQIESALKDSLLAKYEKTKKMYNITLKQQKEYITEIDSILDGYKNLLSDYKKLKQPWLSFQGGVGATGGETDPAIMMGFRVFKVHLMGFMQQRNSGLLIGTHFDLF